MEHYITDCPFKTPAMTIQVLDLNRNVREVLNAPPGFQFLEYICSLHPDKSVSTSPSTNNRVFSIQVSDVGFYVGTYNESIDEIMFN